MASFLRRLRARIKYWNHDRDVAREIETHRDMAAGRFAADGTAAREARERAARALGNTTLAREDARAVWVARWIEQGVQDLRYALRTMRREWGFALTATITLTLGIGVLLAVFTIFNGLYLRPWPVRAPEEVFGISTALKDPAANGGNSGPGMRMSYVVWDQIHTSITSADLAVRFHHFSTLRTTEGARGRNGRFGLVNDRFLDTVGIALQMGTLPAAGDDPAIVISHAVWQHQFGRDPAVIGRRVWMNSHPAVITGVIEPRFVGFPPLVYDGFLVLNAQTSTWLTEGLSKASDILTNPKGCCVEVLGRLRPGFTLAQAADEVAARANAVQATFGLPQLSIIPWHTEVASRPGGVNSTTRNVLGLIFAGCAIVTLLACANIGNLQLARGLRRTREIAVRLSLGANRSRIVRQLLTESAAVTMLGTIGGLLLAWTLPALLVSIDGPTAYNVTPDARVILFGVAIAALATLLSGLAPALRVTRIDWRGATSGVLAGTGRLRGILLATQIALSLSLIASASLLSRGALRAADGANAGFEYRNIHAFSVAVTTGTEKAAIQALGTTLVANPALALGDEVPWSRSQPYFMATIAGRPGRVLAQNAGFNQAAVALLKLPLVAGRWPHDDWHRRESVISRSLALALWNSEDVLGRIFSTDHPFDGKADYSVVGVMNEVRLRDATAVPAVITALRSDRVPVVFGPPSLEAELRTLVTRADPTLRLHARPIVAELRRNMEGAFVGISIATGLGFVALLLASLGVFGVFAYIVEERRREIGVRVALGANRSQVRRSVIASTRWPVIGGLAAGLALALVAGFVLRSNLFGLSILDPLSYLAVAVILSLAAFAATFIPMRRAWRVDPAVTLRQD